ncbi:MAG: ATP-binding cassette domain-containing protein, partial [Roseibium sp.]|uniref:ABC transporter ATP-binding protein n=1 Tax=Roseibium sp. TaxID=1936156 RepID=UPI002633139E
PDIQDKPDAKVAPALSGHIKYEGVSFGYTGDQVALRKINLDIAPGETVAFVGHSGAGKTTLCSLLPRFYDVTEGRISIDGIDLRSMTLASLRNQIGIVQQDVFLFGGTLRENIAYGRLDATEEEILAAVTHARLDKVIETLPDGLNTMIGERGVKLSGGQKQRVAISRIFLKDPPILILDEATSALDTQTELEIQNALDDLSQQRTTLIIAHRLTTIRKADKVAVMREGRIIEFGSNSELLASDSEYRRMTEVHSR